MAATDIFETIVGPALPSGARSREIIEKLAAHWKLVQDWNARINLTAVVGDQEAAWEHYVDSLQPLGHLVEGSILDIGSGAGYPGIPLAIATGAEVTLLEPRSKRVSFLRTAKAHLGLTNVRIVQGRSTDTPEATYANVVTRATFSDRADLMACAAWLRADGRLLALRTAPSDPPAKTIIAYQLEQKKRVLEVWDAADLSGP